LTAIVTVHCSKASPVAPEATFVQPLNAVMSKNGDRTSLLEGNVNKRFLIKFETKLLFLLAAIQACK